MAVTGARPSQEGGSRPGFSQHGAFQEAVACRGSPRPGALLHSRLPAHPRALAVALTPCDSEGSAEDAEIQT